jgi:hypothetical protein
MGPFFNSPAVTCSHGTAVVLHSPHATTRPYCRARRLRALPIGPPRRVVEEEGYR